VNSKWQDFNTVRTRCPAAKGRNYFLLGTFLPGTKVEARPLPTEPLSTFTYIDLRMCLHVFDHVRETKDFPFIEVLAQYLHSDRKLLAGHATRYRDSRNSDKVSSHRIDII